MAYEKKYLMLLHDIVLRVTTGCDCTVYLFGSRAGCRHRRSSDIDIGFSGLDESSFTRVRDSLLEELEESIIPHHVDIVNFDTATGTFRELAMRGAVVWKQSSRAN